MSSASQLQRNEGFRESELSSFSARSVAHLRQIVSRAKQVMRVLEGFALAPIVRPDDNTYLFIAINGAGLGHLTRCLAVARSLKNQKPDANIVFYTTSIAVPIVASFGFYAYHVPPAVTLKDAGYSALDWNFMFAKGLGSVMAVHRPGRVVFDGTYPYLGLQLTMFKYRRARWVWIRRGLSRQTDVLSQADKLAGKFQLVMVPGEIDQSVRQSIDQVVQLPPVLLLRKDELLSESEAKVELGLDPDRPAVYVQLGAGTINDIEDLQGRVVEALRKEFPSLQVVLGRSPISLTSGYSDADATIVSYPNSRYFAAFEMAVLAAGYNSVAEAITFRLPAIFFPNTRTSSDDQENRASAASRYDCWKVMTEWEESTFAGQVRELLQCEPKDLPLAFENGAQLAAANILQLV